MSDAGSNVRRALAGRITKDGWREGDNLGDWARCACHMLHNVMEHAFTALRIKADIGTHAPTNTLQAALDR